jgi:molecular chaperone GrpE
MPIPFNPDDLNAEIDASIIEAALAAVEKRSKKGIESEILDKSSPQETAEISVELADKAETGEIEIAFEEVPSKPEAPSKLESAPKPDSAAEWAEERKRWLSRQLDSSEKLRKQDQELKKLRTENQQLKEHATQAQSTLQERTAEFESTRQRQRKDREEAERVAEERVIKPLLEISDNLERAMSHATSDPNKIMSGLHMIMEQFRNQLKRAGAERIPAAPGTPFDPEVHEAVLHLPSTELAPGLIVSEVSSGFRLKGRMLRAARVVVAAAVSG